jgi:hypothetical protein
MLEIIELLIHFVATFTKLLKPGGVKVVMAEMIAIKKQLIVMNRRRKRASRIGSINHIFRRTILYGNC